MTPEFSRIVALERISASDSVHEIAADDDECRALAQRFGIVAIDFLAARVRLRRTGGDIGFRAHISARVVQECVVTLEPVESDVEEEVTLFFRPVGRDAPEEKAVVISVDEDFEPLPGEALDIGEAVAVELALALDPFPRSPDADAAAIPGAGDDSPEPPESPFRMLAGTGKSS